MIQTTAVLDASALVRAIVRPEEPTAVEWVRGVQDQRVLARVPELVYAEVANALARYERAGKMTADAGDSALDYVLGLPLVVEPLHRIARAAYGLAVTRRMSTYDACYLALALGHDAVLVTADRALAAAAPRSALLPETGPPAD